MTPGVIPCGRSNVTARAGLTARLFCCLAVKERDVTVSRGRMARYIGYITLLVVGYVTLHRLCYVTLHYVTYGRGFVCGGKLSV